MIIKHSVSILFNDNKIKRYKSIIIINYFPGNNFINIKEYYSMFHVEHLKSIIIILYCNIIGYVIEKINNYNINFDTILVKL